MYSGTLIDDLIATVEQAETSFRLEPEQESKLAYWYAVARTELAKLDGYKFSITETHHTTKLDAPSGTALTLKEIIQAARPGEEIEVTSQPGDGRAGLVHPKFISPKRSTTHAW